MQPVFLLVFCALLLADLISSNDGDVTSTLVSTTITTVPPIEETTVQNLSKVVQDRSFIEKVYGRVNLNVSVPCNVDVIYKYGVFTTTWKKENLYLASAQKNSRGDMEVYYLDDALKEKYTVMEDFSLSINNLEIRDSSNYTCSVTKYKTESQQEFDGRFINATFLLVQDVPSPPSRPVILQQSSRSVLVNWKPSLEDNNSPIIYYRVKISSVEGTAPNKEEFIPAEDVNSLPSIKLFNLRPFTAYRITVQAINDIGLSAESSASDIFMTTEEAPEAPPQDLVATSNNSSRIRLSWKPPPKDKIHGELQKYEITYRLFDSNVHQTFNILDAGQLETTIDGLKPFREYEVLVSAFNGVGKSPAAKTLIVTAEGKPGPPSMIQPKVPPTSTSFFVKWLAPDSINGRIVSYELRWTQDNTTKTKSIFELLTNPMQAYVNNLEPYKQYYVEVRAVTGGGKGEFSKTYPVRTDVAGPGPPFITNATVISSSSLYLQWQAPTVYFRDVESYFIQISDMNSFSQQSKNLEDPDLETVITGLPSNRRYKIRIAGKTKSLYSNTKYIGEFSKPVEFQLIGYIDLNDTDEGQNSTNTIYAGETLVFAFPSNATYEIPESDPAAVEAAEQEIETAKIIAGVICGFLFVLLTILAFIGCRSMTCRKYYAAAYNYLAVPTNSHSPPTTVVVVAEPPDDVSYPEIPVEEFLQHVKKLHADSDVGFSHEFDDIANISKSVSVNIRSDASNQPDNRSKNRYINITAFDQSRVLLSKTIPGRPRQSDYINANYVDGYKKPQAYIATQGPLPQTFADFWQMVWEQNSVVIVMITKLMEKGKKKCDKYWPDEGIETHGHVQVKHVNTFSRAHYTVRIFSLKNVKLKKQFSERIVHQFHYTEWPDHGVPDFTLPVLKFVQKSASMNPQKAGPIIVHCSAGVGRTGTYILIHSMIEQIKDKGTVNVPGFLLHIRRQRNLLVQTEEQYMLIHDALAEYLLCPDSEVKVSDISAYINKLSESSEENSTTLIQKQYQLVTAYKPRESDKSAALKVNNAGKNQSTELIPLLPKRVTLPFRTGVEDSDYINASYLQGYNKTDEFILTQHPMEHTVEDFWRMVWDKNSSVIVLLSPVKEEEEFGRFWPEKDNPVGVDAGNFKLSLREDSPGSQYSVIDFLLESTQDDYTLMTSIMSCPNWPHKDQQLCRAFNLIERVKDLHLRNDIGPVIVVDRFGGVEGARFCALWSLNDQIQHDKTVDIYHLCKLYHKKRPNIIGTIDDYLLLYKAIEDYVHDQAEKESASFSHHLHLRSSGKKNGTLPRSPTLQHKVETTI